MADPVTLTAPIQRGDTTIARVTLRKPTTGSLRGLKLSNVLTMDVNSLVVLLPRITEPALLPDEVAALDPADLMALSAEVISFFMTPAQAEAARVSEATLG